MRFIRTIIFVFALVGADLANASTCNQLLNPSDPTQEESNLMKLVGTDGRPRHFKLSSAMSHVIKKKAVDTAVPTLSHEEIVGKLKELKLQYRTRTSDGITTYKLIPPQDGAEASSIERFIRSVKNNLGIDVHLSASPMEDFDAIAVFEGDKQRVVIGLDMLNLGSEINFNLIHEIRHAFQARLLAAGEDSLAHGDLFARDGMLISDDKDAQFYSEYMAIDEISSFSIDLRTAVSNLRTAIKNGTSEKEAIQRIHFSSVRGAALTGQLNTVLKQAREAYQKGSDDLGIGTDFLKSAHRDVGVFMAQTKRADIMLYFPDSPAHQVFENFEKNNKDGNEVRRLTMLKMDRLIELTEKMIPAFKKSRDLAFEMKKIKGKNPLNRQDLETLFDLASEPRSLYMRAEKEYRSQAAHP